MILRRKPRQVVAAALLLGLGCGREPSARGPVAGWPQPAQRRAIGNGSLLPTLYPDLAQPNAVVALWERGAVAPFCGGALISPRVVVTAAHCLVLSGLAADDLEVRLGASAAAPLESHGVLLTEHLDWTQDLAADLGVLLLDAPAQATAPLGIARGDLGAMAGALAQVVGYGATETGSGNTTRYWASAQVVGTSALTIAIDALDPASVLSGDSGSPLLWDAGQGVQVVGVASAGWEDGSGQALYAPVTTNAEWLQAFVDRHDNPLCQAACQDLACGLDRGCACGACLATESCAQGQCLPAAADAATGLCVGTAPGAACQSAADCATDQGCLYFADGSAECSAACVPAACAPGDAASLCMPYPDSYGRDYALCLESQPFACADAGGLCTTGDGRFGLCRRASSGALRCFTFCQRVATCPAGSGCYPIGLRCEPVCGQVHCGAVDGCDCGRCPADQRCDDGRCVAVDAGTSADGAAVSDASEREDARSASSADAWQGDGARSEGPVAGEDARVTDDAALDRQVVQATVGASFARSWPAAVGVDAGADDAARPEAACGCSARTGRSPGVVGALGLALALFGFWRRRLIAPGRLSKHQSAAGEACGQSTSRGQLGGWCAGGAAAAPSPEPCGSSGSPTPWHTSRLADVAPMSPTMGAGAGTVGSRRSTLASQPESIRALQRRGDVRRP